MAKKKTAIPRYRYFAEGGVLIAKSEKHYLFMDVGEVGQNGLGGHGHNDLLSFELFLNGAPFLIDPGSYLYSGDYAAHDRFRATQAHNSLVVDQAEIASFKGNFRIANDARPIGIRVKNQAENVLSITACHTGYHSLPDPVTHCRSIMFDTRTGAFHCRDILEADTYHRVKRFLHFAPGIVPLLRKTEAHIDSENGMIIIRWGEGTHARLEDSQVSQCFGSLDPSKTVTLEDDMAGDTTLDLDIFLLPYGPLFQSHYLD